MAKTKSKKKAKKTWIDVDQAFAEITADPRMRPSTVMPLVCTMCGSWLEAKAVHHSSGAASDQSGNPGVLFELTFFALHNCATMPRESEDVEPE